MADYGFYACTINGPTGSVSFHVPEKIALPISVEYSAPQAQGLSQNPFGQLLNATTGVSLTNPYFTRQQNQGASHLSIQMTAVFFAEDNAAGDVMTPILTLFVMALPKINSIGLLTSKGENALGGNKTSLTIGTWFHNPSIVIKNINPTFQMSLDERGKPIRADVDITVESSVVPDEDSIKNMLLP